MAFADSGNRYGLPGKVRASFTAALLLAACGASDGPSDAKVVEIVRQGLLHYALKPSKTIVLDTSPIARESHCEPYSKPHTVICTFDIAPTLKAAKVEMNGKCQPQPDRSTWVCRTLVATKFSAEVETTPQPLTVNIKKDANGDWVSVDWPK